MLEKLARSKTKMKNKITSLVALFIAATCASVSTDGAFARGTNLDVCQETATCNNLSYRIVRCDAATHGDLSTYYGFTACAEADDWTSGYRYLLKKDEIVAKDQYLMVKVFLEPASDSVAQPNAGNIIVGWDTTHFTLQQLEDANNPPYAWDFNLGAARTDNYTSLYPYPVNGRSAWYSIDTANAGVTAGASKISIQFSSSEGAPTLSDPTEIAYFMLKADGANVEAGGAAEIYFDEDNTSFTQSGTTLKYGVSDYTVDFGGNAQSEDATLSSLSITKTDGSVTYPLDPAFTQTTAAENQKVYSTKVPSDVSQIKINATANDDKVQGIKLFDGDVSDTSTGGTSITDTSTIPVVGVGTKSLNPGDNEFTIAVTSENGNILNQVVDVYKLSNDANLKNLSVDGYNFTSAFSPSTTSYTIGNVPYSTKSINVVGAVNDTGKATVSGLGLWNFDSDPTAAMTFTRNIVVTPEECNYTSGNSEVVQGASCVTKTYTITVNREAASNDANLKSLSASYVHTTGSSATTDVLIPSSEAGKTIDLGSIPYAATSISFSATANQEKAKKMTIAVNGGAASNISTSGSPISGTATCALNVGDNTCVIEVTAEDNSHKQTYTIKAHRRSNDATLKSISVGTNPSIGNLTPTFNPSVKSYDYYYSEKTPSYVITATVNDTDKTQSITMSHPSGSSSETGNTISKTYTPSYNISADVVNITVTSEDGNTETYKVNLYRQPSSDASLSSIKITTRNDDGVEEEHTITPTTNTYNYTLEVEPNVSHVTNIAATPTSAQATIESGDIIYPNDPLAFGTNSAQIKVKPESGNKSQYNITITRKKYNIAGASKIEVRYGSESTWNEVEGVSPNQDGTFDLRTQSSNPVPFNTSTVEIRVTAANYKATIAGDGVKSLVPNRNNAFVVKVEAQDGSATRTYTLNIFREGDPETGVNSITVKGFTPTLVSESEGKYTLSVPYTVSQITEADVQVNTKSSLASVTKSGTLPLKEGMPADYNITVTAQNGDSKTYTVTITREKNSESGASLIKLRLDGESQGTRSCSPTSTQTTCTFSIPYNKSQYYLEAVTAPGARVSSDDPYVDSDDLLTIDSSGTSTHQIKVISQDDSSETVYTITVNREQSTDNTLTDLNLSYTKSDGSTVVKQTVAGFLPSKAAYNVTVPGDVTHITIGASLTDNRAKFVETNSNADYSKNFSLNYDLNELSFDVMAENGAVQTYIVNVTRQRKTNPYIQNITINGTDLNDLLVSGTYDGARAGGTYEYTLKNFPNGTSSITIDATMVDAPSGSEPGAKAILVSNNQDLPQNVGIKTLHYGGAAQLDNTITIKGLAHDGVSYQNYILHIFRDPSSDARVSDGEDAVQVYWDGAWHNATWNGSEMAYQITVPNSVSKIKGPDNFLAKPMPAPENGAAGTVSYDPELTLVTDSPTTGNVNTYNFKVTAEDGSTSKDYRVQITKEKSDNANLASIAVNDDRGTSIGSFNPNFSPDKLSYTVTVGKDVSEIYIAATPAEGHANVTGTGRQVIDGIDDVFQIEVIPENGDTAKKKTYTLTIVREKSDDATLSKFEVTNLNGVAYTMTPAFSPSVSTVTYQVVIPGDQDRVMLEYAGSTSLADGVTQTIVYTETPDESTNIYNIPTGSSRTIGVRVTAENGTSEKTYNVTVSRTKRQNALLNSLTYTYNGGTAQNIDLESCIFADNKYTCDIGQLASTGASGITFGATAADDQATISGDVSTPLQIQTGRNSYKITVTAEDGVTKQDYNITLLKKPSEEAKLTSLGVKESTGLSPSFSSTTTEYTTTMNSEDKATFSSSDIVMTQASNRATATFAEPINLEVFADNWYTIIMRPEACDSAYEDLVALGIVNCADNVMTYRINVRRKPSSNSFLSSAEVDSNTRMTPSFLKTGNNYRITIPYGSNRFEMTAIPEHDTSTVTDSLSRVFDSENSYKQFVYFNDLPGEGEEKQYRITVTPQSGDNPRYYDFTVTIAKSDNKDLSRLQVFKNGEQVSLTPEFSPSETNYTIPDITNDVTELTVNAQEENPDATYHYIYQNEEICGETISCRIPIDPTKTLQTIKVEVSPADGSTPKVYRIDFNIKKDNNANLANLTVAAPGALDSAFTADDTEYTVTGLTYENVTGPIALKFSSSDPDAKVSINGGAEQSCAVECTTNLNFDLVDKNAQTITTAIKVIAEDGTTKTYAVTATRAAAIASSDPTLSSLSVTDEELSPSFTMDHTDYDIGEISYQKQSVEVVVRPNNEEAHVFVNGNEVTISGGVGRATVAAPQTNEEQTVTVRVVAGNNVDEMTYTIKFHKNGSADTSLSRFEFTNGTLTPAYNPDVKSYTLTLGENQQTGIIAAPSDANATMSFGSPNNMQVLEPNRELGVSGLTDTVNTRQLVIMAEDGTIETISITIERITGEDRITSVAYGHNITARTVEVSGEIAKYGYILSVADRDIGARAADGSYPDYENSPSGSMTVELLASQLDNQRANLHFYKPKLDENGIFIGKGDEITSDEVIGTGTVVTLEVDNVLRDQVIVIIKGDVNGDGVINYKDRGKIINHNAADGTKLADGSLAILSADINNDGTINYKDRGKVINHTALDGSRIDYGAMLNPSGGGAPSGS